MFLSCFVSCFCCVMLYQLTNHLNQTNGFDSHQSAYRRRHSCETAITYLLNSVFRACDQRKVTVLVMLDLTAAFDTVDHSILCQKLFSLGVSGDALSWIASYLSHRSQSVLISSSRSSSKPVGCGVPQGSVLGPLLFVIYMFGISRIFSKHDIPYVIYADDIQLWRSCSISELPAAIIAIERCVAEVRDWLAANKLCLNFDKTEVILLGSRQLTKQCAPPVICIDNVKVEGKSYVRDLGVILDQNLTFDRHISLVSSSAFFHLRVIGKVRNSISTSQCLSLVHALVVSRLLYCCSIYHKVTSLQLSRLQRILNAAIRLAARRRKSKPISDIVQEFHWLPIDKLIFLRISCLVFSIIHSGLPKHLRSEIDICATRGLRSADTLSLKVLRSSNEMGMRAFCSFAPLVWNQIPTHIRKTNSMNVFREKLLTHLNSELS
jgi:hypothetical protein